MVTDKEAKNAVNTIIQYCRERSHGFVSGPCAIESFCDQIDDEIYCHDIWQKDLKDYEKIKEENV